MTYEELKEEARKMGYHLTPNGGSVRLLPCICGGKRRERWSGPNGGFLKCTKCGRRGGYANSARGEKLAWNEMIEKEAGNETD